MTRGQAPAPPLTPSSPEREWAGGRRRFYAMPHNDRYIWGATAGMLRNLWERLNG